MFPGHNATRAPAAQLWKPDVGEGVDRFRPGDRVATFKSGLGAYSSARIVNADWLVSLPQEVDFDQAASLMLKGCTAEALIERCAKVQAGDVVLVHAGAGATGQIMIRWLAHIGARVVATASTDEKRQIALSAGASAVCGYDQDDVMEAVLAESDGRGADLHRAENPANVVRWRKRGYQGTTGRGRQAAARNDRGGEICQAVL